MKKPTSGVYPVATEDLAKRQDILNLSGLARAAGVNAATLRKYVSEGRALSPQQALAIGRALKAAGIELVERAG